MRTGKKQLNLNLWHGMPFKRIAKLLENSKITNVQDYADITISTSILFQEIMSKAFNVDKKMF